MNEVLSETLELSQVADLSLQVVREVEKAIVGKQAVLNQMMAALLCPGGHLLLEDYPGLAKTLIANSFATALGLDFSRIQFTPDLLPGRYHRRVRFRQQRKPVPAAPGADFRPHGPGR